MKDYPGSSGLTVSIATSDAEREECCALRYRVYVAEQGRPSALADHERRLDLSADDASGILFRACLGDDLVGTVRVHHGATTGIPPFIRRACMMPEAGPLPTAAAFSRLAIDRRHRGNHTVVTLFRACDAWLRAEGRVTTRVLIVAFDDPRVIALYRLMGFKPLQPVVSHMSEIGPVVPMTHVRERASG